MLILVAVTISLSINSGLFEYAGRASSQTEEAKKDEQDLASLGENMTTDQLIAKYTTNKKEDLAKLKRFYLEKDEDAINGDIELIASDDSKGKSIIKYNNNLYIISYEEVESEINYLSVEFFEIKEDEIMIVGILRGSYIIFKPGTNKTWYEWALEDNDVDLSIGIDNLTLKQVILDVNSKDNKQIIYSKSQKTGNGTGGRPLSTTWTTSLKLNTIQCTSDEIIKEGSIYELNYSIRMVDYGSGSLLLP